MNGYLKIAIISTILLFISFQTEKIYCKLEENRAKVKI